MAAAEPAPADPQLQLLAEIAAELRGVRQELALLRQALGRPAAALANNGPRLNEEVWRRLEAGGSSEGDTEMDLLIDRLHDLALENGDHEAPDGHRPVMPPTS